MAQLYSVLLLIGRTIVDDGRIISVKEVAKELSAKSDTVAEWAKSYKELFQELSVKEAMFVAEIFKIKHFQNSLEKRKLLKGGAFADPFIIAKAKIESAYVVTGEDRKPNSAKIPNICEHFKIKCTNLDGFMEQEDWRF